ncbi:MAG: pentapeptide repeat-containing protein [Patescibacteria group bacterium]|nr:pentapeptide repeat-containing protein [Patescibacteria group bacterium]
MTREEALSKYAKDKNLRWSNLRGSDLSCSNLSGSNLSGSDLSGSNLSGSDLSGSNLSESDLSGSNLRGSNLRGSDLRGSNLSGSDLSWSNLRGSNLSGSDLSWSNLRGSNLRGSNLSGCRGIAEHSIVPEFGSFHGFKKLKNGVICELIIGKNSKRVGGLTGRKCRAEYAKVVSGTGVSSYDSSFEYQPGKVVRAKNFDPDPRVECAGGIHFFLTREEAESY